MGNVLGAVLIVGAFALMSYLGYTLVRDVRAKIKANKNNKQKGDENK